MHSNRRILPAEFIGIRQTHPASLTVFLKRGMKCFRSLDYSVFPDTPDLITLAVDWGKLMHGKLLGCIKDHVKGFL